MPANELRDGRAKALVLCFVGAAFGLYAFEIGVTTILPFLRAQSAEAGPVHTLPAAVVVVVAAVAGPVGAMLSGRGAGKKMLGTMLMLLACYHLARWTAPGLLTVTALCLLPSMLHSTFFAVAVRVTRESFIDASARTIDWTVLLGMVGGMTAFATVAQLSLLSLLHPLISPAFATINGVASALFIFGRSMRVSTPHGPADQTRAR